MSRRYVVSDDSGYTLTIAADPVKWMREHDWAMDARDAAQMWAEKFWTDLDNPDEMECTVTDPEGEVTTWTIRVEMEPVFSATEEKGR